MGKKRINNFTLEKYIYLIVSNEAAVYYFDLKCKKSIALPYEIL